MKIIKTDKRHFDKYNNIVEKKGSLDHAMPVSKDEIINAINNGDFSLNTISLNKWDPNAAYVGSTSWKDGKASKSLAEQVCTLKHYAIYKYAGFEPEFEQ